MGGVLGGAFGSTFVSVWVMELERSSWLWIYIVLTLIIVALATSAGSLVRRDPPPEQIDVLHRLLDNALAFPFHFGNSCCVDIRRSLRRQTVP